MQTNNRSRPIVLEEYLVRQRESDGAVEETIRRRIENNGTYAYYFNHVTCECSNGVLKVCGDVPTERLKNALWSLLEDLDGVTEVDDQLNVVSSTGLSSVRPRYALVRCKGTAKRGSR